MELHVESRDGVKTDSFYDTLLCIPEAFQNSLVRQQVQIVIVKNLNTVCELQENTRVSFGCFGMFYEKSWFVERGCAQKSLLHDLGHVLDHTLHASQEKSFEHIVSKTFSHYESYNAQRQVWELREWFARGFQKYCLAKSFVQKIGFAFWYPDTRKYFIELEKRVRNAPQ